MPDLLVFSTKSSEKFSRGRIPEVSQNQRAVKRQEKRKRRNCSSCHRLNTSLMIIRCSRVYFGWAQKTNWGWRLKHMFHKKVNPNFNLKRNFFLPLEHDCSSRGSRIPREDPSPEASSSFFPLHDTLFTSEDSSITPKSNLVHYVVIETVENRNFAHTAQTDFPKKEGTWISIQRDGSSNSNRTTDSRDENDESKKSYCKEYLHHSKKFSSSKKTTWNLSV